MLLEVLKHVNTSPETCFRVPKRPGPETVRSRNICKFVGTSYNLKVINMLKFSVIFHIYCIFRREILGFIH